jgi:hypothetical protein
MERIIDDLLNLTASAFLPNEIKQSLGKILYNHFLEKESLVHNFW